MLFSEIKSYFLEQEANAGEAYVLELEECSSIEEMIQVVAEYNGTDDYEASYYILTKICQ